MKINGFKMAVGWLALAAWNTGCVERRVVEVPVYQPQPVYVQSAPSPGQVVTVPPPGTVAEPQYAPAGSTVVVQTPPQAPVEVVPVAPGPAYVWVPGYWSWHGRWVWVRGAYAVRPRPHAVWVGGHWARHRGGYVWVGGYWR